MKRSILFCLICLFWGGCSSNEDSSKPNLALISETGVSLDDICYQFYEKFGFTDQCEHYRSLYRINQFKPASGNWRKLPITKGDLVKINKIENKVDTIGILNFNVKYKQKDYFRDISLEMNEYFSPRECDFILDMKNGFYLLNKEGVKIYDQDKNMFYEEIHRCDDKGSVAK